jgi:hypothetical protein
MNTPWRASGCDNSTLLRHDDPPQIAAILAGHVLPARRSFGLDPPTDSDRPDVCEALVTALLQHRDAVRIDIPHELRH